MVLDRISDMTRPADRGVWQFSLRQCLVIAFVPVVGRPRVEGHGSSENQWHGSSADAKIGSSEPAFRLLNHGPIGGAAIWTMPFGQSLIPDSESSALGARAAT